MADATSFSKLFFLTFSELCDIVLDDNSEVIMTKYMLMALMAMGTQLSCGAMEDSVHDSSDVLDKVVQSADVENKTTDVRDAAAVQDGASFTNVDAYSMQLESDEPDRSTNFMQLMANGDLLPD